MAGAIRAGPADASRPERRQEADMDEIRRHRMLRDMEQEFLPDYDAGNMPAADKRAAYAMEHIAFRMSRIDNKLDQLVAVLTRLAERP
jgi:hypothetical protein